MNPIQTNDITAVILAGGQGSRMGGIDKGLVMYGDKPLVGHVIDAIRLQLDKIIVNANRSLDDYATFGFPVVADDLTGFQGPLAGFVAAMQAADSDYILTLPCDGPIVHEEYVEEMRRAMQRSEADIVVASDGEWMQPVYALIPCRLLDDLKQFLDSGERKIDRWYAQHQTMQLVFPAESGFFTNINTLQELDATS
jgi:molybdenum cofactor guanylyltransferase